MRRKRLTAVAAVLIAAIVRPAAAAGRLVGALGDPARLTFSGRLPASPERLRYLLAGDLETALAAQPSKPLDAYLHTVTGRLTTALMSSGYSAPTVTADVDPSDASVVVILNPGPRRRQGPVRITGDTAGLDVSALLRELTTPSPSPPFRFDRARDRWSVGPAREVPRPTCAWWGADGNDARFDAASADDLADEATRLLSAQGRLQSHVTVDVTDEGGVGLLTIHVRDAGPPATVAEVVVTGATRNAPAAVVAAAGVRGGQPFTMADAVAAQQRLWDTGRFDRHTITVQPAARPFGAVVVTIDVVEGKAPPLGQPLTEVDRVLLRVADRLQSVADGRADVRFKFAGLPTARAGLGELVAAVGDRTGLTVRATGGPAGSRPQILSIVARPDRVVAIGLLPGHDGVVTAGPPVKLTTTLRVDQTNPSAPDQVSHLWRGNLGWAAMVVDPTHLPARTAYELNSSVPPAALLDTARNPDLACGVQDGVLTITSVDRATTQPMAGPATSPSQTKYVLRVDAASGVVLGFDLPGCQLHVDIGPGLVEDETTRIGPNGLTANGSDGANPIGTIAVAVGVAAFRATAAVNGVSGPEAERAAAVLAKVISPAALEPLAMPGTPLSNPTRLGMRPSAAVADSPEAAQFYALFLPVGDHLFARDSWPWHYVRGTALMLMNQVTAASAEATAIGQTGGPLACLAAAETLAWRGSPAAQAFARRGLDRLSADAFASDVRAVLTDGTAVAEVARRVTDNIRSLSPAELDDLSAVLTAEYARQLRLALFALQSARGRPGNQALAVVIERAWDMNLRDAVAGELHRLADEQQSSR